MHHQHSNIIIHKTTTCLASIGGHLLRSLACSYAKNANLSRNSLFHPSLLSSALSDSFIASSCLLMCMGSCWLQTAVRCLWAGRASSVLLLIAASLFGGLIGELELDRLMAVGGCGESVMTGMRLALALARCAEFGAITKFFSLQLFYQEKSEDRVA